MSASHHHAVSDTLPLTKRIFTFSFQLLLYSFSFEFSISESSVSESSVSSSFSSIAPTCLIFALREEYLVTFRESMKNTIENVRVIDPNGEDVTPEKLKQIQAKRHTEEIH